MITIKIPKRLKIEKLTFPQRDMFALGTIAVEGVKARLAAGRNAFDGPAKPLSKRYARRKMRAGLRPIRDLKLTGKMLGAFRVRKVSENQSTAGVGAERSKARFNQQREPWLLFSESNRRLVLQAGQEVLNRLKDRLIKTIPTRGAN